MNITEKVAYVITFWNKNTVAADTLCCKHQKTAKNNILFGVFTLNHFFIFTTMMF